MKNFLNYLYNLFMVTLCIIIIVFFIDSFIEIHLCDTGSINQNIDNIENVKESDTITPTPYFMTRLRFTDKIGRRISWYVKDKYDSEYNTYNDFKDYWDPKTKVWKEIKSAINNDLKKSRLSALEARRKSNLENGKLMLDIKRSRETSNMNRINRYIQRLNPRKK